MITHQKGSLVQENKLKMESEARQSNDSEVDADGSGTGAGLDLSGFSVLTTKNRNHRLPDGTIKRNQIQSKTLVQQQKHPDQELLEEFVRHAMMHSETAGASQERIISSQLMVDDSLLTHKPIVIEPSPCIQDTPTTGFIRDCRPTPEQVPENIHCSCHPPIIHIKQEPPDPRPITQTETLEPLELHQVKQEQVPSVHIVENAGVVCIKEEMERDECTNGVHCNEVEESSIKIVPKKSITCEKTAVEQLDSCPSHSPKQDKKSVPEKSPKRKRKGTDKRTSPQKIDNNNKECESVSIGLTSETENIRKEGGEVVAEAEDVSIYDRNKKMGSTSCTTPVRENEKHKQNGLNDSNISPSIEVTTRTRAHSQNMLEKPDSSDTVESGKRYPSRKRSNSKCKSKGLDDGFVDKQSKRKKKEVEGDPELQEAKVKGKRKGRRRRPRKKNNKKNQSESEKDTKSSDNQPKTVKRKSESQLPDDSGIASKRKKAKKCADNECRESSQKECESNVEYRNKKGEANKRTGAPNDGKKHIFKASMFCPVLGCRCSERFTKPESLQTHWARFHQLKALQWICKLCKWSTYKDNLRTVHLNSIHKKELEKKENKSDIESHFQMDWRLTPQSRYIDPKGHWVQYPNVFQSPIITEEGLKLFKPSKTKLPKIPHLSKSKSNDNKDKTKDSSEVSTNASASVVSGDQNVVNNNPDSRKTGYYFEDDNFPENPPEPGMNIEDHIRPAYTIDWSKYIRKPPNTLFPDSNVNKQGNVNEDVDEDVRRFELSWEAKFYKLSPEQLRDPKKRTVFSDKEGVFCPVPGCFKSIVKMFKDVEVARHMQAYHQIQCPGWACLYCGLEHQLYKSIKEHVIVEHKEEEHAIQVGTQMRTKMIENPVSWYLDPQGWWIDFGEYEHFLHQSKQDVLKNDIPKDCPEMCRKPSSLKADVSPAVGRDPRKKAKESYLAFKQHNLNGKRISLDDDVQQSSKESQSEIVSDKIDTVDHDSQDIVMKREICVVTNGGDLAKVVEFVSGMTCPVPGCWHTACMSDPVTVATHMCCYHAPQTLDWTCRVCGYVDMQLAKVREHTARHVNVLEDVQYHMNNPNTQAWKLAHLLPGVHRYHNPNGVWVNFSTNNTEKAIKEEDSKHLLDECLKFLPKLQYVVEELTEEQLRGEKGSEKNKPFKEKQEPSEKGNGQCRVSNGGDPGKVIPFTNNMACPINGCWQTAPMSSPVSMACHMATFHMPQMFTWSCIICDYCNHEVTTMMQHLAEHMESHSSQQAVQVMQFLSSHMRVVRLCYQKPGNSGDQYSPANGHWIDFSEACKESSFIDKHNLLQVCLQNLPKYMADIETKIEPTPACDVEPMLMDKDGTELLEQGAALLAQVSDLHYESEQILGQLKVSAISKPDGSDKFGKKSTVSGVSNSIIPMQKSLAEDDDQEIGKDLHFIVAEYLNLTKLESNKIKRVIFQPGMLCPVLKCCFTKKYRRSIPLAWHMYKVHCKLEYGWICDLCGMSIASNIKLLEHITRVHSEKAEIVGEDLNIKCTHAKRCLGDFDKRNYIDPDGIWIDFQETQVRSDVEKNNDLENANRKAGKMKNPQNKKKSSLKKKKLAKLNGDSNITNNKNGCQSQKLDKEKQTGKRVARAQLTKNQEENDSEINDTDIQSSAPSQFTEDESGHDLTALQESLPVTGAQNKSKLMTEQLMGFIKEYTNVHQSEIKKLEVCVKQKGEKVTSMYKSLAEKDKAIRLLKKTVDTISKYVEDHKKEQKVSSEKIIALEQTVEEKNIRIIQQEQTLQERDRWIEHLEKKLQLYNIAKNKNSSVEDAYTANKMDFTLDPNHSNTMQKEAMHYEENCNAKQILNDVIITDLECTIAQNDTNAGYSNVQGVEGARTGANNGHNREELMGERGQGVAKHGSSGMDAEPTWHAGHTNNRRSSPGMPHSPLAPPPPLSLE